jgi:hypothetical protein
VKDTLIVLSSFFSWQIHHMCEIVLLEQYDKSIKKNLLLNNNKKKVTYKQNKIKVLECDYSIKRIRLRYRKKKITIYVP